MHPNRQLEQIIQRLTLRLRLRNILAPDIDAVSTDKNCARLWPLLNGFLERVFQILFVGGVLDDRNLERVVEAKVADLSASFGDFVAAGPATGDTLDLLDLVDGEDVFGR